MDKKFVFDHRKARNKEEKLFEMFEYII
jgi:hypothetical protein